MISYLQRKKGELHIMLLYTVTYPPIKAIKEMLSNRILTKKLEAVFYAFTDRNEGFPQG